VFLPDTMAVPDQKTALLWTEPDELPFWKPPGDDVAVRYAEEKSRWRERQMQEYRRLLYVGLTRAQDRLYICGWQTKKAPQASCWHGLCRAGLLGQAQPFAFDTTPLIGSDGWSGEGLRIESRQTTPPKPESIIATAADPAGVPDWVWRPAPAEPDPPRPLVPSRPIADEPAALSPVALPGDDRFKRGLLVHRLLQSLPDLSPTERPAAARRFLALPVHALTADAQDDILHETLAVLDHPDFAPLFAPGSLAEVPIVGIVGGRALSGQIDRMIVAEDRVLIVDFKTLRAPPESEHEVPAIYLSQLAGYHAALARLYPDREICCALLWTQGPRLMPISNGRLASR
jgi:ATP-dependent helicase/nuclease subunit A